MGAHACRAELEAGHVHTPNARSITTLVKPSTPVPGGPACRGHEPSDRSACEGGITGHVSEDQMPEGSPFFLVGFHALILVAADKRQLLIAAPPTVPAHGPAVCGQSLWLHPDARRRGSGGHWPRNRVRHRDVGRRPHWSRGSAEHWAAVPLVVPRTYPGQGRGPGNVARRSSRGQRSQRCPGTADPEARRTRRPGDAARTGKNPLPSCPCDRLLHTPGAARVRRPRQTSLISDHAPSQGPAGPRDLPLPSDREDHPPNMGTSCCQLFPTQSWGSL